MNASRNWFVIVAATILLAFFSFEALGKGKLSGFLLEQGFVLMTLGAVIAIFVWLDFSLRRRRSAEWMKRYYRWVFGITAAVGVIFIAARLTQLALTAKGEGGFWPFVLTLLCSGVVVGTVVALDIYLGKRRAAEWMTGFRIGMALMVAALIMALGVYLLTGRP